MASGRRHRGDHRGGRDRLLAGDAALVGGAGWVILPESSPLRLAKAAGMRFATVDSGLVDPAGEVRSRTGGLGIEVALECAGVPVTVRLALAMLRRGGRCAAVGIPTLSVEIAMLKIIIEP